MLSRSGRPLPAVKFHEGAVAAFSRLLRSAPTSAQPALEATHQASVEWQEAEATGPSGPDWAAYYAGAREGLADLIDELQTLG